MRNFDAPQAVKEYLETGLTIIKALDPTAKTVSFDVTLFDYEHIGLGFRYSASIHHPRFSGDCITATYEKSFAAMIKTLQDQLMKGATK